MIYNYCLNNILWLYVSDVSDVSDAPDGSGCWPDATIHRLTAP